MKKLYTLLLGLALLSGFNSAKADEGMWIPALITDNYAEMQRLGLKLSAEQLYSINSSSMKDAIVRMGRGFCTGEIISDQGLLLTNHHCGYDAIQKLSSTTANHLKNGYWAKSKSDELPAGFSVSFLVRIDDITDEMLKEVNEEMSASDRNKVLSEKGEDIEKRLAGEEEYDVDIKEMFSGNKYFAYVYQTFKDVRLVGTPPESVGKYGGDTDNWMWPRHTGDFSMFRVYANRDNKPADYSLDNVPYKPKHHLPVSLKGVEKGDFAMIWGVPGSTDRYLTSYGVKLAVEKEQPARVKLRRSRLDIFEKYQMMDEVVDLMYATKHAQVSNYWKYFIGQTRGLQRLRVYEKKQAEEKAFVNWVNQGDAQRKAKYGEVMDLYKEAYAVFDQYNLAQTYMEESVLQIELLRRGFSFGRLLDLMEKASAEKNPTEKAKIEEQAEQMLGALRANAAVGFKGTYTPIDREVAQAMLNYYIKDIPESQRPEAFNEFVKKYKNNTEAMVASLFKKSFLADQAMMEKFLEKGSYGKLKKDEGVQLARAFVNYYLNDLQVLMGDAHDKRNKADRLYKAALFEMHPNKKFAPNANSSIRFTYGQVLDYSPGDAMFYKHYTTMTGVLEKYKPGDHEFDLPENFLEKARAKDYGPYAKPGEDLRICFLSNNDITGGNSGSPVINGNGELIGLAFDGNWEAMSGDIAFEPELQRTISVDIRYVLWCIDKLAGAGHIVEEMTLVKPEIKSDNSLNTSSVE